MAKNPEPLITVDLGANGGEVKFRTVEEIESWVNHEVTFWQWLQKCTSYDNFTGAIWSQQADPWNKINDRIGRLKSNLNDQERIDNLKAINDSLLNSYTTRKSLHSSTPHAKRLLEYNRSEPNQKDIVLAAYMLGYFIKAPFKINSQRPDSITNVIIATQEAILFERGVIGVSGAERSALDELRATHTALNNELTQLIADSKAVLDDTQGSFTNLHGLLTEKFDGLFDASKKTLDDIANTYDKKLALQAAVAYWTKKAERHRNFSIGFGVAFVTTLIGVGYLGFQELYPILKDLKPDEKPESWIIALIVISAVVSVWIVRLIVRVLLSHIHLQRDSSERATMLLTYLALAREGSGLKEDEKKLILQALFRPSASGIIKDDAIPTGIYDFITRPK